MRFLDLFSGIGGFRMGLENAGHECVGYVEIDKFARKSYEAIFNTEGEWTRHDITKITDEEWRELRGRADLICGGFPCQAFSIAGRRLGFAEDRGNMFFEIARAVKQIKPQYLLLENVKGLLNHDKGETFGVILKTLDELGYDAEWRVLNSKDFGVPQNRERVFIVGYLRGTGRREVFPIPTGSGEITSGGIVSGTLTTRCPASQREGTYIKQIRKQKRAKRDREIERVYDPSGIAPCLNTMGGGQREPKIALPILTPDREEKRQNGRRVKEPGEPMFTLTAQDKHGVTDGVRVRKLTPLECWRLQGFPDWAFYKAQEVNSDSQLYKQAGNSVTVNVIEWLGNLLREGEDDGDIN